jgi:hypothetical protein
MNNNTGPGGGGYASNRRGDGGDGGGIYCETTAISNCIIAGNSTGKGGNGDAADGGAGGNGAGIACTSGIVSNCTVTANKTGPGRDEQTPQGNGGGIYCGNETTILDSIIWDNSPDGLFGHDCNNISYSDIQDGNCTGSSGNISADPLFIFAPLGEYYIRQAAADQGFDSPCVDAGSDMAADLGMDIYTTRADKLRDQGIVDIGYHYRQTVADLNDDGIIDVKDIALLGLQWQQAPGVLSADIVPLPTGDGTVDIHDLALLADWWLWPW